MGQLNKHPSAMTNFSWPQALQLKWFTIALVASGVAIGIFIAIAPYFFNKVITPKQGIQLSDFILNALSPSDYSVLIFILIYSVIAHTVAAHANRPLTILAGLVSYALLTYLRMISLYVITLEPPLGIIELKDPLLGNIAYGNQSVLKDLFFSGHVSALTLMVMLEKEKLWFYLKIGITGIVAFLIMKQRVHYSIDVVVGIAITILIYQLVKGLIGRQTFDKYGNPSIDL